MSDYVTELANRDVRLASGPRGPFHGIFGPSFPRLSVPEFPEAPIAMLTVASRMGHRWAGKGHPGGQRPAARSLLS